MEKIINEYNHYKETILDKAVNGQWSINPYTGLVDVNGSVNLSFLDKINKLPVKFGKVTGDFDMSYGSYKTLKGSPYWVGGFFDCCQNKLKNLKYLPNHVGGSIFAYNNPLRRIGVSMINSKCIFIDMESIDVNFHVSMIIEIERLISNGVVLLEPETYYYPYKEAYHRNKLIELL
jgi:hypothetical protein